MYKKERYEIENQKDNPEQIIITIKLVKWNRSFSHFFEVLPFKNIKHLLHWERLLINLRKL